MKLIPKAKKTTDVYYFDIYIDYGEGDEQREIKIIFIDEKFHKAEYPFRGTYLTKEWQALKLIAEKIDEIAGSYQEVPEHLKQSITNQT